MQLNTHYCIPVACADAGTPDRQTHFAAGISATAMNGLGSSGSSGSSGGSFSVGGVSSGSGVGSGTDAGSSSGGGSTGSVTDAGSLANNNIDGTGSALALDAALGPGAAPVLSGTGPGDRAGAGAPPGSGQNPSNSARGCARVCAPLLPTCACLIHNLACEPSYMCPCYWKICQQDQNPHDEGKVDKQAG